MGDVSIPEPEPNRVGAKVHDLIESGHEFYATTVTGRPQGRTRRPTLFVIAFAGLALCLGGVLPTVSALVAFIAMLLLAYTDNWE